MLCFDPQHPVAEDHRRPQIFLTAAPRTPAAPLALHVRNCSQVDFKLIYGSLFLQEVINVNAEMKSDEKRAKTCIARYVHLLLCF